MVSRAVEINSHGDATSPTTEWQFVSTRVRPHPIKEYFTIYIEEGLPPKPWRRMLVVARDGEADCSQLLKAPFP